MRETHDCIGGRTWPAQRPRANKCMRRCYHFSYFHFLFSTLVLSVVRIFSFSDSVNFVSKDEEEEENEEAKVEEEDYDDYEYGKYAEIS